VVDEKLQVTAVLCNSGLTFLIQALNKYFILVIVSADSMLLPLLHKAVSRCALFQGPTMLDQSIYYADKWLLDQLDKSFELVDRASWYRLYRRKEDGTYWRLDEWDKLQTQYFVRIDDRASWQNFDAVPLQIDLLRTSRGASGETCRWAGCSNCALTDLAFCEQHAYREMGVRR